MINCLRLGRDEVVVERPFSNPDHIVIDTVILRTMIDEIHRHLFEHRRDARDGFRYFFPSPQQWQKRILLTRPRCLHQQDEVTIVGFFGKVNPYADAETKSEIKAIGQKLCEQLTAMPSILAYFTWLLSDELNYANLVVLKQESAIEQWRYTNPHIHAKDTLSPKFYDCVRIYNGRSRFDPHLNGRVISLKSVKYWDYRQSPTWHAIRELEDGE